MFNKLWTLAVASLLVAAVGALGAQFATRAAHAASHERDSFVLVFGQQVIPRGPDFSVNVLARAYKKKNHLRDLVLFSTKDGCFVSADRKIMVGLRETEKAQDVLGKKEDAVGGSDLALAAQLSREQTRLSLQRDEVVWGLFDRLQKEHRLTSVAGCPNSQQ